jgi:hypothetical protein
MHSLTLRHVAMFCYVQIVVSWVVTLCGLVDVYKFLEEQNWYNSPDCHDSGSRKFP